MSDPTKHAASSLKGPPAKKRSVMKSTADKWIADNDKTLSTSTWLRYDTDTANRGHIVALKCCVCYQFRDKLIGMRNYSAAYIEGSSNLRASSFKEHAASVMHTRAILLLKKKQGSANLLEYAPIAKALLTLDDTATARIKRKFDIAYLIAKENMAFAKMGPLCTLEERHGVDLGQGYKNELACASFVDYIAQEQQKTLAVALSTAKFFGLQADGSTDAGNVEDEVFLAVYFDLHAADGRVHVRSQFFAARRPARANAEGLFACLEAGLAYVGVADWDKKLVGFGCDGQPLIWLHVV